MKREIVKIIIPRKKATNDIFNGERRKNLPFSVFCLRKKTHFLAWPSSKNTKLQQAFRNWVSNYILSGTQGISSDFHPTKHFTSLEPRNPGIGISNYTKFVDLRNLRPENCVIFGQAAVHQLAIVE